MKSNTNLQSNSSIQVEGDTLIDEEFMHIYRTMHTFFYIDIDGNSQYSLEEQSIEGV